MTLPAPYYQDEAVTLYCADCRDILPLLPKVDLVLTDPPYGIGVKYDGGYDDDRKDYWEWIKTTMTEIRNKTRLLVFTHRVIALKHFTDWDWCGAWYKKMSFACAVGNSNITPHYEPIFYYGIHTIGKKTKKCLPDVIECAPEPANSGCNGEGREKWVIEPVGHPCPKPIMLFTKIIAEITNETDAILDPFCGSGTTLVAAKQLGRKAIGIEISQKYCDIAVKRLSQEYLL